MKYLEVAFKLIPIKIIYLYLLYVYYFLMIISWQFFFTFKKVKTNENVLHEFILYVKLYYGMPKY